MNFPYQAMLAETVTFHGHHSDLGEAYYARPLGPGRVVSVVNQNGYRVELRRKSA